MPRVAASYAWCSGIAAIIVLAACAPKSGSSPTAHLPSIAVPYSVQLSEGVANNLRYHLALPAHSPYRSLSNTSRSSALPSASHSSPYQLMNKPTAATFYPGDVDNIKGGPVVVSSVSHNIYVNCEASCWGNPDQFLRDLSASDFIHLVDQYVGQTTNGRYTVGEGRAVKQTIYGNSLDSNEILAIVDKVAQSFGNLGYHAIYHVFLPKGVDTCISGTDQCYSPDDSSTFIFCAYHISGDFPGNRHVLYTVEPYQYVDNCSAAGSAGGSPLENSTDSSLSHEMFETITDPDVDAWLADAQAVSGQEIGDLCAGQNFPIQLGPRLYQIQLEYSNAVHGCALLTRR